MAGRIWGKKNWKKKNVPVWVPGHRALVNVPLETLYVYVIFKRVFIYQNKQVTYSSGLSYRHSKKEHNFFCYCSSILIKKLTVASGRSASTGNLQIASPKSWWCRRYCRWQFVFHRDSTPQSRPWNCKKSGHESTETERETLREKELAKKKTYGFECPLTGHSYTYILKSFTFISFSRMYLSTKSCIFELFVSRTHKKEHDFFLIFL